MKSKPINKDCPCCNKPLDINTLVPGQPAMVEESEMPDVEPGDVTFCFQCRTVLVINEALNVVVPDPFTLMQIVGNPNFHSFSNEIDTAMKSTPNMN